MEEKRKDTGTPPPAPDATPSKQADPPTAEAPPTSRRRGGGQKRKASAVNSPTPPTTSAKRQAREKPNSVQFTPIHNGPLTRARQHPNNNASASTSAAASPSGAEAVPPRESSAGEAVKAEEELIGAIEEELEALEAQVEKEYEAITSRGSNAHVVPNHAGWFSWTKIHTLEERTMPSFFNGKSESKTPEIYIEIRNWIMRKFHADPNTLIELKDLAELPAGELDAKQEVMEFLDYWGLINYHPFPKIVSADMSIDSDSKNEEKKESLLEKLFCFETEETCAPTVPRTNVATPTAPSRLFPESAVAEESVKSEEPSVEYHCNSCSGDCSRKRYHCQKQADFDLCTECFKNGKFDSFMSPSDFILMEPAEAGGASGEKWTDQETLLLLEALELYKENWNEIAEHVATKTKAQCILHFVQMPIEDVFFNGDGKVEPKENASAVSDVNDTAPSNDKPETIDKNEANDSEHFSSPSEIPNHKDSKESNLPQEIHENCALMALKEAFEAVGSLPSPGERLSFAEASNPVMTMALFLVKLIEPDFATASVRCSLKSLARSSSGEELAMRHCFLLDDPPDDEMKTVDSERIDTEMAKQEAEQDKVQSETTQNVKEHNQGSSAFCSSTDQNNLKEKKCTVEEERSLVSPSGECEEKSGTEKEITRENSESACANGSDNVELPKEHGQGEADSDVLTSKDDLPSASTHESKDGSSVERPSQFTEAPKDEGVSSDSEKKESKQVISSNLVSENGAETGGEATERKNERVKSPETRNDLDLSKIKRAAVAALSAAAVKAKLLADEEEYQIRLLASLLIEKQLHKLETKLGFFYELENAVMRAREHLERSRQKLFHERAQIIASRLGISGSGARPMQLPLHANRAAMAFANLAPRPMIGMTAPRPPLSRPMPMMASTPTPSSFAPATVTDNSMQPPSQDKLSSASMK